MVVDDLSMGHEWAVKFGPLERGNLIDADFLNDVPARHQPDAVIHFAAASLVGESMQDPAKYFRMNSVGSLNLLDAMRAHDCNTIVFSSTAATYGEPTEVPIKEDIIKKPVNPYGESKLIIEQMIQWYGSQYGMQWAALRYFNVAGADPAGELGEERQSETHLIPVTIQATLGKRPGLKVFGTDYPTPDGTAIRDYIHVWDLVNAHRLALEHLVAGNEPFIASIGTGTGISVREIIDAVERVSGQTVPAEDAPRRAGDPEQLVADPTERKAY